jgi:hypothetical protein
MTRTTAPTTAPIAIPALAPRESPGIAAGVPVPLGRALVVEVCSPVETAMLVSGVDVAFVVVKLRRETEDVDVITATVNLGASETRSV